MTSQDCIFCKIISGEVKSEKLYQDDKVAVVRDINPKAPVHLLVLPVVHFRSPGELFTLTESAIGHLLVVAGEMARREGVAESGYRLVVNVGPDGGQEIEHLHMHLLGGCRLGAMG